ncbi:unnamed protein product [Linum tenue]|uniref:Methyltransferase type 11 domain-containing protein n=1 Tax=Linum tenue TaxID=586396 RepID=A0AAV0QZF1_9ROSI|nr:unnamed protein product [Linum tenue]
MEKRVENLLNKVSYASITIATIALLITYLQIPETCIPPDTPITKPHQKFPSSTCDSSLRRPYLSPAKKNIRLWSSKPWISQLNSFTRFFSDLQSTGLLPNHSRVLCLSAGAGHEVMALHNMGVGDVTGIEIVESLPLVRKADPTNLPFFDAVFDFAFTARLSEALFPARFVGEMERTVAGGGYCVLAVEECGKELVDQIVGLFHRSKLVGVGNVTLIGMRMTRIIMKVGDASSSSS